MMVSPASRMLSAISLGVFCRSAPSTNAIIRSRKVSPGLEVMRTLITSESTRVPPVTADRSPPASRITGADSPVIADSSTEATPSMISPSEGINSPADTWTRSPVLSLELGTSSVEPLPRILWAKVSDRAWRKVSAWALPRPSAIASAKLANSTVNQSHKVICKLNLKSEPPLKSRAVVITLPISTTNMTGFPIIFSGLSFRNESQIARLTIFHSQTAFDFFAISSPSAISRQLSAHSPPAAKAANRCRLDGTARSRALSNQLNSEASASCFSLQPPTSNCNSRSHGLYQTKWPCASIAVTANKPNADSGLTPVSVSRSKCFSCHHLQLFQNRSQTKCWKKCQRSDYENRSDQKHTKKRRRDREGTERRRNVF